MRSINEKVIEEHFISQFNKILNHAEIVICSDVRPRDFSFMKHHNFLFIHIEAEESLSLERRKKRGDISLANSKHWTEKQDSEFIPDYKITNNGSLEDYKLNVLNLVRKIYDSYR